MIIWGSQAQDKRIAAGTFYCPSCRTASAYSHQRIARWLTLCFIPLFPLETLGEYVLCLRCAETFKPLVLAMTPEQVEALVRPWPCASCGSRNPPAEPSCLACSAWAACALPRPPREAHAALEPGTPVPQA